MKVHIIMHESFEAPVAIEQWVKTRECEISYTKLYSGDPFPESYDFDFLFVKGGLQCPTTTKEE